MSSTIDVNILRHASDRTSPVHEAAARLVPGAHVAALAITHGIRTIYTHDRDFRKFPFVKVADPVA